MLASLLRLLEPRFQTNAIQGQLKLELGCRQVPVLLSIQIRSVLPHAMDAIPQAAWRAASPRSSHRSERGTRSSRERGRSDPRPRLENQTSENNCGRKGRKAARGEAIGSIPSI